MRNNFRIFTIENLIKIDGFTQESGYDPMTGAEQIWLDYCKCRPHVSMVRDSADDLGFCFKNDKLQYIEYFYQEDNPYDDYDYTEDKIVHIDDKDTDETIIKKLDELGVSDEILNLFINSNKA